MKASSAKAKGRRLQQWVCEKIASMTAYSWGPDEHIASREMGQSGVDVRLTGPPREDFPFDIECKYQERVSLWEAIAQAKKNKSPDMMTWLLFLKKNRVDPVVVMDADFFFFFYGYFREHCQYPDQVMGEWEARLERD
jgi:hypothetical protein